MLCYLAFINRSFCLIDLHSAIHRHSFTLEPLRTLTVNALNPIIGSIVPMSRKSSDKEALYPLICYAYNQDKILLPHTKTIEETVKLLEYYLEIPKNHDIELTTKWNGSSDRVRLVAHVWPYIAGAVDDIKVTSFEKGLLSP